MNWRRGILIVVCILWVAAVLFGLTARAYGQMMQTREPRPTPGAIPQVDIRTFSHGWSRVEDYDNEMVCWGNQYAVACKDMR